MFIISFARSVAVHAQVSRTTSRLTHANILRIEVAKRNRLVTDERFSHAVCVGFGGVRLFMWLFTRETLLTRRSEGF